MDILKQIIDRKKIEVDEKKELYPVKLLERSIYFNTPVISFKKYLLRSDKVGIIAEIKRRSPSKGFLNPYISIERTSIGYMQAGASALSILTDNDFFNGKNDDLTTARHFNYCPILRKDFIINEYQIVESKSIGADAILLIARILGKNKTRELAKFASSLGLEIVLEISEKRELSCLNKHIDIVAVNNRNLNSFKVNLNRSLNLAGQISKDFIKISESGINHPEDVIRLRMSGYQGFLVGEKFMATSRPEKTCASFIRDIRALID